MQGRVPLGPPRAPKDSINRAEGKTLAALRVSREIWPAAAASNNNHRSSSSSSSCCCCCCCIESLKRGNIFNSGCWVSSVDAQGADLATVITTPSAATAVKSYSPDLIVYPVTSHQCCCCCICCCCCCICCCCICCCCCCICCCCCCICCCCCC